MNRRHFLTTLGYASAASLLPLPNISRADTFVPYEGELLVTVQANGGWDVSSFCDPKINTDSAVINHWADGMNASDLPKAGNIAYAPFANNASLFERFHDHMLVINGIDSQTNAHGTGRVHTWSGRTARGYPSLTAMFASQHAPTLPVSYLNFGGYAETARLIRYSRIDKIGELRSVLQPNEVSPGGSRPSQYFPNGDVETIMAAQQSRLARLQSDAGLLPRQKSAMASYFEARPNVQALEHFSTYIPDDSLIESSKSLFQAQVAVLGFKAGVTCAADIELGGFDTHTNSDSGQESALGSVSELLEYLWDYAESEGVAERMTVVVGSDFARTPYYNNSDGKNHWPVGSVIVMRKNAPWGNRVISGSDENQNALFVNPATLLADNEPGSVVMHPMHVHSALRRELGLSTGDFSFTNTEEFDFFNPSLG
ncbi:hypothetical protein A9Q99_11600 [Gammaproteobacteria bacterium 45_16_T64]|mgnify:CR=1 FL=1|nr:hypothetical protein A9Q99_11600 [Gammaproteobacteria bacterium 45_16_T64]